jgi:hypothetical protein
MHQYPRLMGVLAICALLATALAAGDDPKAKLARPKPFDDVVACKEINDAQSRLACYDEKVETLAQAEKSKEIVVTDKQGVREAKRGLFGFSLPKIGIFGGDDGDDEIAEIEAVAQSASINGDDKWFIILEDGAKWQQIDNKSINRKPKAGLKIHIRKAALGSYFVNIDGAPAIRMKRVN